MSRITMAECRQIVAEYYHIPKEEFVSRTRIRRIARPRQMAMTLAREFTDRSLNQIAMHFGLGDHTSVVHAGHRVAELEEFSVHIGMNMQNFRLALQTYKEQQEAAAMDLL